jgi:hypothetical protein
LPPLEVFVKPIFVPAHELLLLNVKAAVGETTCILIKEVSLVPALSAIRKTVSVPFTLNPTLSVCEVDEVGVPF